VEVAVLCTAGVEGDVGGGVPDHVGLVVIIHSLLVIYYAGSGAVLSLPVNKMILQLITGVKVSLL
jgi:hypothetical protein